MIDALTIFARRKAIRRKIESELARKRTLSTTGPLRNRRGGKVSAARGTVAALKPLVALTVSEHITVSDASQLCAAKRTDCVLVVDEEESLSGIFTAKDLAYRVRLPVDLLEHVQLTMLNPGTTFMDR